MFGFTTLNTAGNLAQKAIGYLDKDMDVANSDHPYEAYNELRKKGRSSKLAAKIINEAFGLSIKEQDYESSRNHK